MTTRTFQRDEARAESRRLIKEYYSQLDSGENRDKKTVYLFTAGNISEFFRAFNFRIVFPEINAVQCSRNNMAVEMIREGESLGYTSDICSYVKCDLGLMAGAPDGRSPMGKIPRPDLIVINHVGCSTYIKWGEALSREFNCPVKIIDVPFLRENLDLDYDKEYIKTQIEELIPVCEEVTGVGYDRDRLIDILKVTGETVTLWKELLQFGMLKPSPIDGYFDASAYMAPMSVLRGTEKARDYYRNTVEYIRERAEKKFSPVEKEIFRLLFVGSPPWPRFNDFRKMFASRGAVAVVSSYVRVVCAADALEINPEEPMEFLASLTMQSIYNWNHARRIKQLEQMVKDYSVDAVITHSVKSCRPMSIGQLDIRNYFARDKGIPALFLDSDIADPRYFSDGQMKNRIDTFLDAVRARKERDKE